MIAEAARLLASGELVAFPTETVYGLGADARNPAAVAKIFAAKGRPADHPVIVHFATAEAAFEFAHDIPAAAKTLAARSTSKTSVTAADKLCSPLEPSGTVWRPF